MYVNPMPYLMVRMFKKTLSYFREAHYLFLVVATLFGVAFSVAVPPLWGFDETSHFARVYQISGGHFLQDKSKDNFGGTMPRNFNAVSRYATADIGEEKDPNPFTRKDVNNYSQYRHMLQQKFSKDTEQAINPAGYSPLAYPLSEVLVSIARVADSSIGTTLYVARLGGLVTFIGLGFYALWMLRGLKSRWLLLVVALSPVMLVQAATLSADTVTNALALVFMSLLIVSFVKPERFTRMHKIALALAAVWMPAIKLNYLFLSSGVLLLPGAVFRDKLRINTYRVGTLAIAAVTGIIWTLMMSVTTTSGVSPRPDGLPIDPSGQLHFIITHPFGFITAMARSFVYYGDAYIHEMFGVLGWNYVVLPLLILIPTIIAILLCGLYAREEFQKIKVRALLLVASCCIGVASIFAILYMGFTPVAKTMVDGVQGRYLLPFLIPFVIVLVSYVPVRLGLAKARWTRLAPTLFVTLMLGASFLYYVALTY